MGLSEDLYRSLVDSLYAVPAEHRRAPGTRWVMSVEWWRECRNMTGGDGFPLWEPPQTHILGLPVEVRTDGGAPHLETA